MHTLKKAASDNTRDIGPPGTWQELQRFCVDAFPLVQEKFSTGRKRTANYWLSSGYGKNGDTQNGVDIYDRFSPTTMQCKRVEKFKLADFEAELKALRDYHVPISAHFIVTSLDETSRFVTDRAEKHNADLESLSHGGIIDPVLPAIRLPKVYVLNWPEIKAILYGDFFLSLKWGFHPFHLKYSNLNGVDLSVLVGAVNTMKCSVPPGGGGKSLRVLDAISVLTQSLDADAIASLGEANAIDSAIFDGFYRFLALIKDTVRMARMVKPAMVKLDRLDGVSRHEGLTELNDVVNFQARIEAYKCLNRLAGSIKRLVDEIDEEYFFAFGEVEVEYKDQSQWETDERVRHYNFTEPDTDTPPWYIPRSRVMRRAQFIAREIHKVRFNLRH
ncbi:hypothetical protein IFU20_16785 [Pseudomonas viridiflava]|uniref:hypothetical protein n=1 Tax=Pseudomonas viridiflava TaxID=33069 RepID=UPI00177FFC38|nr:hypothetical protein [Pseudomonas viridiflava]MBD8187842.1 hypothetical protein [Pseudomonas viridiflava]